METTMFTVGVLSMILAALVATVVYGIVTVLKLKTNITNVYRQIDNEYQQACRRFEDMQRDVNMIEQTLRNSMNSGFDATERLVRREDADVRSYIDSRIDKLVDVYFDTQKTKKQILKD